LGEIEELWMKLDKSLEPFRATIESLNRLLQNYDHRGVIIGGIAVGLLGKPRFTADVDAVFLLSTEDISRFLELASTEHIIPRIQNAEEFARKSRVLLLKHAPTEIDVDISLGILPFEQEMVDRGSIKHFANLSTRLPTPEDLIIMKAIAHRTKDLEDIRTLVNNHPDLDRRRIEKWVRSFAEALELPNLWDEIKQILNR
jgi:hypothetical protein